RTIYYRLDPAGAPGPNCVRAHSSRRNEHRSAIDEQRIVWPEPSSKPLPASGAGTCPVSAALSLACRDSRRAAVRLQLQRDLFNNARQRVDLPFLFRKSALKSLSLLSDNTLLPQDCG